MLMGLLEAFHTIYHDLLIAKLQAYGFNNDSLKLLCSYLNNRYKIGQKLTRNLVLVNSESKSSI